MPIRPGHCRVNRWGDGPSHMTSALPWLSCYGSQSGQKMTCLGQSRASQRPGSCRNWQRNVVLAPARIRPQGSMAVARSSRRSVGGWRMTRASLWRTGYEKSGLQCLRSTQGARPMGNGARTYFVSQAGEAAAPHPRPSLPVRVGETFGSLRDPPPPPMPAFSGLKVGPDTAWGTDRGSS